MHFLEAGLLGVVEGLTEFLPVSSTGHLILAARALRLPSSDFLKSFEIAIQSGAMLAVVFLYGQVILLNGRAMRRVLAAFFPTAVMGFVFHDMVKEMLLDDPRIVITSLIVGGVVMILFEKFYKVPAASDKALSDISYLKAFGIGACQALAMIPGVSRSAATILAGMGFGLDRKMAVEFSFLLAIPTLLAATGLDLLKSSGNLLPSDWQPIGLGTAVSFFVAIFSMKFFLHYIQKHSFSFFGYYRIALAIAYLAWVR